MARWNWRSLSSRIAKIVDVRRHPRDCFPQCGQVRRLGIGCSECRDLAFNQLPCIQQFERPGALVGISRLSRLSGCYKNPGADPHLDQPGDFERNDRFAHRRARDSQKRCQLPLGRQPRAPRELARLDEAGDLFGDLAIETAGLDGLKRHSQCSPGAGVRRRPASRRRPGRSPRQGSTSMVALD
jgi:hypothetical protein